MLNNKTFLRIISLIAAILLWIYVMGEIDPQKSIKVGNVPVVLENEDVLTEKGLAPMVKEEMEVTVKIRGKRSQVNDIKQSGLIAYADIADCKKGQNRVEIKVNTPDGISTAGLSDEYMMLEVEELSEVKKPVSIGFEGNAEMDKGIDKVPWILGYSTESAVVSGAESSVNRVVEVKGTVSAEKISENHGEWVYASVSAVDKNGRKVPNVAVVDSGNIQAEIRLMSVKSVEVELVPENMRSGYQVKSMSNMGKIRMVGPKRLLDDIDKVRGTVDLKEIDNTEPNEANVDLNLPMGIYLYDEHEPLTVDIELKKAQ